MKEHLLFRISNKIYKRNFVTSIVNKVQNDIRNIGIMAHIDAGKTTTTERMLYYSGHSQFVGEVHHGDTVMDYLPQERERGITITAAAITFPWKDTKINLIDTPGHVDFAMEVEKSLRVLDGAVAVFDGSAGVEAQSITVWQQAERYGIPRICYINKLDKPNSNLDLCIDELERKLEANVIILQKPISNDKKLTGVVDIIAMKKYTWKPDVFDYGMSYYQKDITPSDGELWEDCNEERCKIVEKLSDLDDSVAEAVIESGSIAGICEKLIKSAIRRCTLKQEVYPVFVGSSYKNIGVQQLMDGIIDYLPSPEEKNIAGKSYFPSLFAYVFKIIHDSRLGALSFCRIYNGSLKKGQKVYNLNKDSSDKIKSVNIPYADEFKLVNLVDKGNIAALAGLQTTSTGDILVLSQTVAAAAKKAALNDDVDLMSMLGVLVPQPVFLCSIEAPSLGQQKTMDDALVRLQREDPSLRVHFDEHTQQTIIAGMGELHLQIIKDRMLREYEVAVALGKMEVAYKETISDTEPIHLKINKAVMGVNQKIAVRLSLKHRSGAIFNEVKFSGTSSGVQTLKNILPENLAPINKGVSIALNTGPLLGYPVVDVDVFLHEFEASENAAHSVISNCVASCIKQAMQTSENFLLEPIMRVNIVTPCKYEKPLLLDILKRRGQVEEVTTQKLLNEVQAICPLSELIGYSSNLRQLTSGQAYLSMKLSYYSKVSQETIEEIKSKMW